MMGEAWANLAEKVFSWVTDERGLAEFKKRQAIAALQKDITNAIACKRFDVAAAKLDELKRLSDAA